MSKPILPLSLFPPKVEKDSKINDKNNKRKPISLFGRTGEKEAHLEKLLAKNVEEMKVLLEQFHKQFRPIRGYDGICLTSTKCKGCVLCPHSLVWREYTYTTVVSSKQFDKDGKAKPEYKFLWKDSLRHKTIPDHYVYKHRSAKSFVHFLEYEAKATRLNEKRKKITGVMTSFRNQFHGLLHSNLFKN